MRSLLVVVLALSTGACVGTTAVSAGGYVTGGPSSYSDTGGSGVSADVSVGLFQSELSPYGQWISASSYGSCWQPSQQIVGYEFEPYATGGSWAWTDAGWQFESDLPFGWATFHYGRWLNDPEVGWCWAPGTEWAPSWVSWRYGDGFVGWAPLPPDNWAYRSRYQPRWVIVDAPHFVARDAWRYRLPDYHRAYTLTRPVAPTAGRVVGPPPQQITQYIGRPVPTAPVARGRPPAGENRPWMRRPEVQQPAAPAPTPVQPPAAQQPPPHRFNPTTPPERHRGWQQEQQQQQQVQPQPPPAAPMPPAAPQPAPPQWGHQRDEERPPRAMPQPPAATPPQGMPAAPPPQPRPPEAHGPPAGVPPAAPPPAAEVRPPPPGQEKRHGPPEEKDPEERKEKERRQRR